EEVAAAFRLPPPAAKSLCRAKPWQRSRVDLRALSRAPNFRYGVMSPLCLSGEQYGRRQDQTEQAGGEIRARLGKRQQAPGRRIFQGTGAFRLPRDAADPAIRGEGRPDVRHGADRRLLPPL